MNSAALSNRLCVGPAGLLRVNPALGTCYPVVGVQDYGQPVQPNGDGLFFRADVVAPVALPAAPAAGPTLYQLAILAGRVGRANWLLLGLAILLVLAACTKRREAIAPTAPDTELVGIPHGLGLSAWHHR